MLRARITELQGKVKKWAALLGAVTGVLSLFILAYQNVNYKQELAIITEFNDVKLKLKDTEIACKLQASAIANQRKDLNTVMRLISGSSKRNVE